MTSAAAAKRRATRGDGRPQLRQGDCWNLTPPGCGLVALLLRAALVVPTAVAQRTPQPVFTELFTYDPAAPSQLLGKWLISSQLDTKLQPLRVGVVEDSTECLSAASRCRRATGSTARVRRCCRLATTSATARARARRR